MSIERIDIHTLREMRGTRKEGLVLQGCGGDLQEWQDGINSMLAVWRLRNLNLEGMWLSDYGDNRLGGEIDLIDSDEENMMEGMVME